MLTSTLASSLNPPRPLLYPSKKINHDLSSPLTHATHRNPTHAAYLGNRCSCLVCTSYVLARKSTEHRRRPKRPWAGAVDASHVVLTVKADKYTNDDLLAPITVLQDLFVVEVSTSASTALQCLTHSEPLLQPALACVRPRGTGGSGCTGHGDSTFSATRAPSMSSRVTSCSAQATPLSSRSRLSFSW